MNESDTPRAPGLLPNAIHRAAKPGTVLLRLETTQSREGNLDGAWWPRSRDIGAELPDLIHVLTGHLGPITRVGLDATAWDELPTRLVIDNQVVHIDSFPAGDDTDAFGLAPDESPEDDPSGEGSPWPPPSPAPEGPPFTDPDVAAGASTFTPRTAGGSANTEDRGRGRWETGEEDTPSPHFWDLSHRPHRPAEPGPWDGDDENRV